MAKKPSISKTDAAALLSEISIFLELLGENPFKSRAYAAASRAIETLPGDLKELSASGELLKVKGIGKTIFEQIETFLKTGFMPYYDELRSRLPAGLLDLLRIPGMGPRKVRAVNEKLGIATLGELEYACIENRLVELDGFGRKSQENILKGIDNLKKYSEMHLYSFARREAELIYERLKKRSDIKNLLITGSLRRKKETIKDIDLVAAGSGSAAVMEFFTSLPNVERVISKGKTKSSVLLGSGINADLRFVSAEEFPCAVHHFTGSKEHNTQLRSRAKKMGMKINEYGLFSGDNRLSCNSEKELFAALGLDFIPPEMREGAGEIEAAEIHNLPELVGEKDIKGVFHVHTTWSDGKASAKEMAEAAIKLGLEYIGIADHSRSAAYAGGLQPDALLHQSDEIKKLNNELAEFTIFHGIESDILADGSLDYSAGFLSKLDFVIASVHSGFGLSETQMTKRIIKAIENPFTTMLGHPTGRLLLAREGYKVDMSAVIDAAAKNNVIIELNSNPHRLDLDWRLIRAALEKGIKVALNPDSHHTESIGDYIYGVGAARKGWCRKTDIVNTLGRAEATELLQSMRAK